MFEIVKKNKLAENVFSIEISVPEIAKSARAGQFVILKIDEKGERIPLTIAGVGEDKRSIRIIFQAVGKTTKQLSELAQSDKILDLLGPLGRETELNNYGKVIAIGGGVGIAELYPAIKSFKALGNEIYAILGAKTKDLLILEEEIKEASDRIYITTDDGSYGEKGLVTDALKRILQGGQFSGMVYAIGPTIMMKKVADLTKEFRIKTVVNLNPIMVDGTGMCGSCRVTVAGSVKFACVDGPEFDAHGIDFEELLNRQKLFLDQEKKACVHKHI